jgi:pimeloyl-ACP methyl ester carboxylesterase
MRWVTLGLAGLLAAGLGGLGRSQPAAAAGRAEVVVQGRDGERAEVLTDGDAVQLRLVLAEGARAPGEVTFRLTRTREVVAGCRVAVGERGCETALFTTLGWHWEAGGAARWQRTVEAWLAGVRVAQSAALQVAPRPVVLLHGFNSNWQTWAPYLGPEGYLAGMGVPGFAVGDGQAPGTMNTGQVTNPTARTNTIAENAAILAEYVAEVRRQTGAEQVDLLAHSMGGLIARYYLDRVMGERHVGQLITVGTPNAGTDCANLPAALGMLHPAALEVRPSYVNQIFNPQITRLHGVPYHAIAGVTVVDAVGAPCTTTPTDLLVSLDSAGALPVEVIQVDYLHYVMTKDSELFEATVKPLLQTPPGSFAALPDPVLPQPAAEGVAFTRIFTGQVAAGSSVAHVFEIEPGITAAGFALFDVTQSLTVSVREASGEVLTLDPATNGVVTVDEPEALVHLVYGAANPSPGEWALTLSATANTPDGGAAYAVMAHLAGGAALEAETSLLLPQVGEAVRVTGVLRLAGETVPIEKALAVIRDPAGGVRVVELALTGGEVDGGWAPQAAGRHAIDVVATGRLADGTVVERSAFLAVEAQPSPNLMPTYLVLGGLCVAGLVGLIVAGRLSAAVWRRRRA